MTTIGAARPTGRRRIVLAPSRDDLVDAGMLLVLLTLAILGFRTTYSGNEYLIVGIVGALLGIVIAYLANALVQPWIAVVAAAVAVYFLAGGAVALHDSAIAGVIPSGSTLRLLSDESVHGWRQLLTTLPPVDGSGSLLVLPYLLSLLGGVAGFAIARRTRPAALPLAAPGLVLAAVILLGTQHPAARLWQGAVFGTVALSWLALRAARRHPPISSGNGRALRWGTVAGLIAVAFCAAALVGPHMPGVDANRRAVWRNDIQPPFDIGQYPSPLAGFRSYTKPDQSIAGSSAGKTSLYSKDLFTVRGLPRGTLVRIATLDSYDGLTWAASNSPTPPGASLDTFQRVGSEIDNPTPGRPVSYTVKLDDAYSAVWLPDAGALTELSFHGDAAAEHASQFRYNLATGTGVVPERLGGGDTYTARARLLARPELEASDSVRTGATAPDAASALTGLTSLADQWSSGAGTPAKQVLAVADHLYRQGRYTNGEKPNEQYLGGHSVARLRSFLGDGQLTGDEEQFAAVFALVAEELGIPARVVLGATLPASGVVEGKNVTAWVEVQLTDGSWRAVTASHFMNRNSKPKNQLQQQQQNTSAKLIPPPPRGRPHSDLADAVDSKAQARSLPKRKHRAAAAKDDGFTVPGWLVATGRWSGPPIGVIVMICVTIIGVKAFRRRRRRTRGTPAVRLAGGWTELVDSARDLGSVVRGGTTRQEQAAGIDRPALGPLARAADARVFGPATPDDAAAAAFWRDVDAARKRMRHDVGLRRRVLAAVSVTSLRRPRPETGGAA